MSKTICVFSYKAISYFFAFIVHLLVGFGQHCLDIRFYLFLFVTK